MNIGKIKLLGLALLVSALFGIAALNQVARAQSSTTFDLGCWGVTIGGAARQSPNFQLRDAVGQWSGGIASSPTAIVRGGYVQDWVTLYTVTPGSPPPTPDVVQFYLPFTPKNIRVTRTCPW